MSVNARTATARPGGTAMQKLLPSVTVRPGLRASSIAMKAVPLITFTYWVWLADLSSGYGGGEDLPLPAPVKPGVTVSRHPAAYSVWTVSVPRCYQLDQHSPSEAWGLCSKAITASLSLLRPSAPHPALSPSAFGLGVLPFPRLGDDDTTGSRVPFKSLHHAHASFTPDTAWPGAGLPAMLIPGQGSDPGSDVV